MKKEPMYIVCFQVGAFEPAWPASSDDDCDGAIYFSICGPYVLFPSRAKARKAIRISAAKAKLDREQGKPCNDDFLGKNLLKIKIVACHLSGGEA